MGDDHRVAARHQEHYWVLALAQETPELDVPHGVVDWYERNLQGRSKRPGHDRAHAKTWPEPRAHRVTDCAQSVRLDPGVLQSCPKDASSCLQVALCRLKGVDASPLLGLVDALGVGEDLPVGSDDGDGEGVRRALYAEDLLRHLGPTAFWIACIGRRAG